MSRDHNGPEYAPIRDYIKEFKIIVTIFDKDDNEIRREEIDYGKPDDRAWLGKLSMWAWQNSHTVETVRK